MRIATKLSEVHPGEVIAVDPNINTLPENIEQLKLVDLELAVSTADLHVMLVSHKEFIEYKMFFKIGFRTLDLVGVWS